MFEKVKQLYEAAKKQAISPVDPKDFSHPIATQTEWHPLRGGGASFQTHRLDSSDPERLIFNATLGAKLFSGVFTLVGLLAMVIPTVIFFTSGMQDWSMLLFALIFGGIFLTVGLIMFYFFTVPRVFDIFYGYFYKGRTRPQHNMATNNSKKHAITELNEVAAIQVLKERVRSKNSSYYSYEINLVLQNASRINVVDHGKYQAVIEDAETLAQTLGVPLWDGC